MATSSDKISEAAKALGYTLAEVELIYSEHGDPDKRQAIEDRAAQLARESWRANYLPSPQFYLLQQACRLVNDAFGSMCYLVGSSLVRRDYRDVDVRLMLDDEGKRELVRAARIGIEHFPECKEEPEDTAEPLL